MRQRRFDEPSGPSQTEICSPPNLPFSLRAGLQKKGDAILVGFIEPFLTSFKFKYAPSEL